MNKNKSVRRMLGAQAASLVGGAALALLMSPASAFQIETGNPDVSMRWDNTVKYNAGWRAESRNPVLSDNPVSQGTNYGWDKGDMVTSRVDLLSEFDFIFKEKHGFRVSGAAWDDFAYDSQVKGHPGYDFTYIPGNRLNDHAERWYKRSGELLDAFVFTQFDVGTVPVSLRAGRHNIYWGESLFTFGNSIAYGQGPLDLRKATSTPGIEAKELFLPQNQVSMGAQLTEDISIAANYSLEWDPHRLPEGGTYLAGFDLSFLGDGSTKPDDSGSFGLMAKVKSDLVGGELGFYYRKFDDRYPTMVAAPVLYEYARDVKLYGVSLSRLVGSVSVGAELSRREGTALASTPGNLATGDSWHGLVNAIAYFGKTALFDSAPLSVEFNYSKLDDVDADSRTFFNDRRNGCTGGIAGGCASNDALGFNVAFTPTWFQVIPGVDLTMPLNYSRGLSGNSPTPLGPTKDSGAWSVGLSADVFSKYTVTLAYSDYFGPYTKGANAPDLVAAGGSPVIWTGANGSGLLEDRGWVSLTLKTTF